MRKIIAFVGGGERDAVILETTLAVAVPLAAHIDFLHAHVHSTQVAHQSKFGAAPAAVLRGALSKLQADANSYSANAADNVRAFCMRSGIALDSGDGKHQGVTATFIEEATNDLETLGAHASQRSLIVIGRERQKQGLTPDTLEYLIRKSGRPILVAGRSAPTSLTGTILICWKKGGSAAAVIRDAAPILAKARRVVAVSVAEADNGLTDAMSTAVRQIAGVEPESHIVSPARHGIPQQLANYADECHADLLVTSAYGRSRLSEIIFGSCTDHLLAKTDLPILLRHR
jgi:nucleotide-binding universal stress UspA family protein